jgi:hypothetical protein
MGNSVHRWFVVSPANLPSRRMLSRFALRSALNFYAVKQGIRRIEDMVEGRATGLTEEQYRAALC